MIRSLSSALKQTYSKFINLSLAVVIGVSGLVTATPLLFSQTAYAATDDFASSLNTNGWESQNGSPVYVDGPVGADGNGSLKLTTGVETKQNYFHAANTSLSDVSGLGYKLYDTSGVPASYQLQVIGVHRTDSASTFTSLVWEPVYNGQVNGPTGSFVSEDNLENGVWWSSHPISGADYVNGSPTYVSLSTIQQANPDAQVIAYGVNVGSGTPNATSYVDDVSFGSDTTNFEPSPTVNTENFNTNAGTDYNGINVGFNIANFQTVSKVSVSLYHDSSLIVTNNENSKLLDLINNQHATELSTPFIIQDGSYQEEYWNLGSHSWLPTEAPTKAVITVTGTDASGISATFSAENDTFVQPNGWTFASFFPGYLTVGCNSGDYTTIAGAVADAVAGDTIYVCGNQTITSTVNISQKLNIIGLDNAQIDTTGSNYVFSINPAASGTTISGLIFNKTDTVSDDAMVYIGANNVTVSQNQFQGLFNIGDSETIRGLVVAGGISGLNINGNTFSHVRQPAYINNATGTASNNYTEATKGWVIVSQSNITFTGNSWGTGTNANYEDIAVIPDVPVGADNYSDILAISQANNGAVVENQVSGNKILPAGPLSTPTVTGNTSAITLPGSTNLQASTTTASGAIQLTIPAGTTITASSNTWDGSIAPPIVMSNSSVSVPTPSGQITNVATVIQVGSTSVNLTFDQAARLVLPGQNGKLVGFVPVGGIFTEITTVCGADDQSTVDAQLTALNKNECKYDNGTDMIVWTKHFTTFVAYSQAPITNNSGGNTNSGGPGQTSSGKPGNSTVLASANSNYSPEGSNASETSGVLGENSSGTPQTMSTKTNQPSNAITFQAPAKSGGKLLGVAWYIWLVGIAVVAGASLLAHAYRSLDRN